MVAPKSREAALVDFTGVTAEKAFRTQDAVTAAFSEALREGRCKPSGRFKGAALSQTVRVLAALSGSWNSEILFTLLVHGPQRFGELRRTLGTVSSRVLTDKLRGLESEGFVVRRAEGRTVLYSLAEHGEVIARHLHPIVFYLNHGRA